MEMFDPFLEISALVRRISEVTGFRLGGSDGGSASTASHLIKFMHTMPYQKILSHLVL